MQLGTMQNSIMTTYHDNQDVNYLSTSSHAPQSKALNIMPDNMHTVLTSGGMNSV